jgi:hypothetical protein
MSKEDSYFGGSTVVAYAIFMEPQIKVDPIVAPVFVPYPYENPPYIQDPGFIKSQIEKQLVGLLDSALKRAESGELLRQYSEILKTLQKL